MLTAPAVMPSALAARGERELAPQRLRTPAGSIAAGGGRPCGSSASYFWVGRLGAGISITWTA